MSASDDLSPDSEHIELLTTRKWFGQVGLLNHKTELESSGLLPDTWKEAGIGTVCDPKEIAGLLNWNYSAKKLGRCLAFPYFKLNGEPIEYVRLKPEFPRTSKNKSVKYEAPRGTPNRAYFPAVMRAIARTPEKPLLITEGEKKALCACQHGFPTIGISGVWAWKLKDVNAMIPDLTEVSWVSRLVYVCFDSDRATNEKVQQAERALAKMLRAHGADVRVVELPPGPAGAKTGIDDFFVRGGTNEEFETLLDAARPPVVTMRPVKRDERVCVLVDAEEVEAEATDQVINALVTSPDLYRRGDVLASVVVTDGVASISPLEPATLRGVISRLVKFVQSSETEEGVVEYAVPPPSWCVQAVWKNKVYPGVRPLSMIVNQPVLRKDGTILVTPGYDAASELYLHWPNEPLAMPDRPNRNDVAKAVALLMELVGDFPFEKDFHRAAWLAALLTPLCRPAFSGPTPFFLVDANIRAAGKGKLLGVIAHILYKTGFPNFTYPKDHRGRADEAELDKRITTHFKSGAQTGMFDDLTGDFGDAVLNNLLTAELWNGRVLGKSEDVKAAATIVWYGTGNNVRVVGDTIRRVCRIRLESPLEKPEERKNFRVKGDILLHTKNHRNEYLAAVLTILRAYHAAGQPEMGLRPWGSYEGWSSVVRNAVVWCGLPDPGDARMSAEESADEEVIALKCLMDGMDYYDPQRKGMAAREMIGAATDTSAKHPQDKRESMEDAIMTLAGAMDARRLGKELRHHIRRKIDGRVIDEGRLSSGIKRWVVRNAEDVFPKTFKDTPQTEPPTSPDLSRSGSGGSSGSVSGHQECGREDNSTSPPANKLPAATTPATPRKTTTRINNGKKSPNEGVKP